MPVLTRTTTLALICATVATLSAVQGFEPTESQVLRADPKTLPLPAEQGEQAAQLIHCHLESDESCRFIRSALLAAPFAWHHSGYSVHVAYHPERSHPCGAVSDTGRPPTGCASSGRREIWLYPGWVRHLEEGRRLGVQEPVSSLLRTLAHEVGHTFHQACPNERTTLQHYRTTRGISSRTPLHGHRTSEGDRYASVAEDFAEAAMLYLLDGAHKSRSPLQPSVEDGDVNLLAEQFFRFCFTQQPDVSVSATPSVASDHPWLSPRPGAEKRESSDHTCSSSMCGWGERVGAARSESAPNRSRGEAAAAARWEAMARSYGAQLDP